MEYRQVKKLAKTNAAYIAGIIDGEGTVTLTRRNLTSHRHLVVTISSTDRDLLLYIQDLIGVGKITTKRTYKTHHVPGCTYQIANRQALTLLRHVAPFLRTYKKERARIALADYLNVTPRNGKYSRNLLTEKQRFADSFFSFASANAKRPANDGR